MLALERGEAILKTLEENGSAMVSDLSVQLGVTEETIRRDLEKLEGLKKIRRVHGGAYLVKDMEQTVPVELRRRFFVEEKKRIAARCVGMIGERESVMLDCSTTALVIAQKLRESKKSVSVITNSFDVIQTLGGCDTATVTCIGGIYRAETASFRGHMALANLETHYADKAFVSCTSLHVRFGPTDHIESEARIRATMLEHAQMRVLIADYTKFNTVSPYKIASLDQIDCIVTDNGPDEEWLAALSGSDLQVIVAK
ncbi:MAG: DeoR/GlpR family DNA-binding transcription regulator [Clostridiales bacterium]|nr:DeoR/GlpR family DNA-binding transcription regulator [Clostridiales bacterium]